MNSEPIWVPREHTSVLHEAALLASRLLDGRMSLATRSYDPRILDLSSNENPFGAGILAQSAILESLRDLHRYPLVSSPSLRHRLAALLKLEEEQIAIGTGATGLLGTLAQLVLTAGARAAYSRSSLFSYRLSVLAAGGVPIEVPLRSDYSHDLNALADAARMGAKIVLISNPHNPTGLVFDHADFERFLEQVPSDVVVVLDEAYREFAEDVSALPRSLTLVRKYANLFILRTFSKVHGLANARIGYAIAQPSAAQALESMTVAMNPGGIGTLAEVAAEAALRDNEHVDQSVRHIRAERLRAYSTLDMLGLRYLRSHTNFIMCHFGVSVQRLVSFLRDEYVLVTSGEVFGYPEWIRFSLQNSQDSDRFFGLVHQFITGIGDVE